MMRFRDEGFEVWYRAEHPRLVAVLALDSGDVEVARDAASEAFARALERWERVGTMASPAAWTYKVALNVVRRHKRRVAMERLALRRQGPQRLVPSAAVTPELWAAVRALPNRQRRAVGLRYVADPDPMPRLQRRARAVRRRRRARQAGTLAAVLLGVLGLTSLAVGDGGLGPIRSPRVVLDQPGSDERLPPVPDGWQTHDEDGIAFHYPAGWSVVADPEGPQVIVGTQRVDERDAHLALLTHPDVVFTRDFPAEGVFFAVGGDRFRPPRDQFSEEVTVGFESNAGGAEIRARFGRVPVSVYQVAAYAGPEAGAEDWSLVERMADTVIERQPRTGEIPPPPPGPPGFPEGRGQPVAAATNEVLRLPLSLPGMNSDVVVLTGDGCVVVSLDEATDTGGPRPQGGRCQLDAHTPAADQVDAETLVIGDVPAPPEAPSGRAFERPAEQPPGSVGQAEGARPPRASEPARRPPGSDQPPKAPPAPGLMDGNRSAMFVASQVGERVDRVESRLVDGRLVGGEVGDGWALVVAEGRIAWLTAYDADGGELVTVFVP